MYAPSAFQEQRPEVLAELIGAHPLATLVVNGADGPLAAYVPFVMERDEHGAPTSLIGHMARANPAWVAAEGGASALAVFAGPDGYVSPSFYPSKALHGRVVPTWDYVRVEVRGELTVETDPARIGDYVRKPTDAQESARATPWRVDDAPAEFVERLGHAIVGLRLQIGVMSGKWKLSQDRGEADFAGVLAGFADSGSPGDRALADAIIRTGRVN